VRRGHFAPAFLLEAGEPGVGEAIATGICQDQLSLAERQPVLLLAEEWQDRGARGAHPGWVWDARDG
jgi:hypothetical protein